MSVTRSTDLQDDLNQIDEECYQHEFTQCRGKHPKELCVSAMIYSFEWQIGLRDADGEVFFDTIRINDDGQFASIVCNYWWNGKEGNERDGGYYSLIWGAKRLEIQDTSMNAVNLADYIEGLYYADDYWPLRELDRSLEVKIDRAEQSVLERLEKHFSNVFVENIYVNLKAENSVTHGCKFYTFTDCSGVDPLQLTVDANLENPDAIIAFTSATAEVYAPSVTISQNGRLDSVLYNKWTNSSASVEQDWSYYSLISHVKTLTIKGNAQALSDLASYVSGNYRLKDSKWRVCQLNNELQIIIHGISTPEIVGRLRERFAVVEEKNCSE